MLPAEKVNQMAKFRTRLAELMEERGLSRMDVVRAADMSYPTVKQWETEALASIAGDKVEAVMKLFDLTSLDALIYLVDEG